MNKNEDVDLKIRAARLLTLKNAPYLGAALWRMRIIKSDRVPTAGVDKWWRLYVNSDFVAKVSTEELAGVWAHEAWHLLRGHARRAEALGISYEDKSAENAARAEIWNVAADCEINDDLKDFKLPAGVVYPSTLGLDNNALAETYYKKLQKKTKVVAVSSGSGSGGPQREWEDGPDGTGVSAGEAEIVRRKVAEDAAKMAGSLPAGVERWTKEILQPTVDWRTLLRGALRGAICNQTGKVDYTYYKPSRRQSVVPNVVLPCLRGPSPKVSVIIDTSGSMSGDDLGAALAETHGVLQTLNTSISVYSCDTEPYKCGLVRSARDIRLVGGGGTDMMPALREAAKERPDITVVFTDGYVLGWDKEKPRGLKDVIIVLIESTEYSYSGRPPTPKWAEVIEVTRT